MTKFFAIVLLIYSIGPNLTYGLSKHFGIAIAACDSRSPFHYLYPTTIDPLLWNDLWVIVLIGILALVVCIPTRSAS